VIQQHHGTTLIQFFYHKAIKAKEQSLLPLALTGSSTAGIAHESAIDESNFRYDGPKPQFKESAIILLADCIEAASRSLKKVTPQSIGEFVDKIVDSKIEDKQLDESPLTMEELKKIKSSFCFTLLNMLHNRVEYPGKEGSGKNKGVKRGNTLTPMPIRNHASSDSNKRAAI
jgi:membrane-associated HD superfamily phosphohydrolase